ncbi:MAG: LTA synthase family protein [Ruminococcaceae bacterium]|nr:LTA synthase family protein [Oscillospiraceae bacterium]
MEKIKAVCKKLCTFFVKHSVLFCFIVAILVNLTVEMFSRQSFLLGIVHVFKSPEVFFYNSSIIFTVLLTCFFFKRRAFAISVLAAPFLVLGIVNCAVLCFRVTPISATDFVKIKSIFGIFNLYLEGWVLISILVAIVAVLVAYILIFKVSVKRERHPIRAVVLIPLLIVVLGVMSNVLISQGHLSKKFTNLNDAYNDYGFVYCFSSSVFDTGIEKPANYSDEKVNTILDEIKSEETLTPEETPNIIFVQLESFFDVNNITSLKYSANPIPTFTSLKANFPHGYLEVPYIGSGTANVEFEIMTGMSLDFFGPGEYPYKTVLQKNACESIAFNLKELGYTAHAIHNHKGSFYDRAHVFSSLGYDKFTPLEFMQEVTYNPIGWANDDVITKEILMALDSTKEQDFVYAITVQSHGVYSEEILDGVDYNFDVEIVNPETKVNEIAFEYYLTQMNAVDDFISVLLEELSSRDEKTVVVLFGDHLPYFGLDDEELENKNVYQTEYVIWSNYSLEAEGKDLYSYQLSAHVLEQLGMNNGIFTKFHQNSEVDDNYYTNLEMLQYDMLYANKESDRYTPSELQLGIRPLTVTDMEYTDRGLEVKGEMFTEFTRVLINGEKKEVIFIDYNTLLVPDTEVFYGDTVSVIQTNGKRTTFAISEAVIVGEDVQVEPWE